jgi:hypothetical protein
MAPCAARVGMAAFVFAATGCDLPEMAVAPSTGGSGGAGGSEVATSTASSGGAPGSGGGGGSAGGASPWPDYCTACALGGESMILLGVIDEASGIAGSAQNDGVFFINNDSGDLPRFFAVADDGGNDGIFSMEPASSQDYEDVAVGPCGGGGSCVFIGDIGDNDEARSNCALYRVAEPQPSPGGEEAVTPVRFPFVYEDGPHNAETLLVHPLTGEIVVVTKVTAGNSGIYRAPDDWAANETATLVDVGSIEPPEGSQRFTGGSVHPAGAGVLLRTYTHLFFYRAASSHAPLAETLAQTPCAIPVAVEAQGEAVTWTRDGSGYVTVSEGNPTALHHATCEMP